jgi:hypothetical protein
MGAAWLMLFGPAVEHSTYVFLAPSLAAALLERARWPRGRWLIAGAAVLVLVLGWGSLTGPLLGRTVLCHVLLPLGTALFTAWLIGYARAEAWPVEDAPLVIAATTPPPSARAGAGFSPGDPPALSPQWRDW